MPRPDRFHARPHPPLEGQPVPDYTGPFLVVTGVLTFCALFALWAAWELGPTLAAALAADRALLWAAGRRR